MMTTDIKFRPINSGDLEWIADERNKLKHFFRQKEDLTLQDQFKWYFDLDQPEQSSYYPKIISYGNVKVGVIHIKPRVYCSLVHELSLWMLRGTHREIWLNVLEKAKELVKPYGLYDHVHNDYIERIETMKLFGFQYEPSYQCKNATFMYLK